MINKFLLLAFLPLFLFSSSKEEEKILLLKDRLKQEVLSLEKRKTYINNLEKKIHNLEIARIEKTVEDWEKRIKTHSSLPPSFKKEGFSLFFKERKHLTELLQKSPSDSSAQALLDRILRLITFLNRSSDLD